jgi:hypothetical protein
MTMTRMLRNSCFAVAAVIGLMLGCSSETQDKEAAIQPPTVEIPSEPSATATTESSTADPGTAAGQEGPKLTPDEKQ